MKSDRATGGREMNAGSLIPPAREVVVIDRDDVEVRFAASDVHELHRVDGTPLLDVGPRAHPTGELLNEHDPAQNPSDDEGKKQGAEAAAPSETASHRR